MFCPQCGTSQNDELKFCKACGVNLGAVRQAVATRETGEKFDWSKTWVTEILLSEGERKRRKEELERQRGITPEVKRYREMKAGVITSSVGIGVAIFLFVFMQGIILGGKVPTGAAEILSRLWIVGVIPLCVGLGLLINGFFLGQPMQRSRKQDASEKEPPPLSLRTPDESISIPSSPSVTEGTTKHLRGPFESQ